jgi:hypothetical protein
MKTAVPTTGKTKPHTTLIKWDWPYDEDAYWYGVDDGFNDAMKRYKRKAR